MLGNVTNPINFLENKSFASNRLASHLNKSLTVFS